MEDPVASNLSPPIFPDEKRSSIKFKVTKMGSSVVIVQGEPLVNGLPEGEETFLDNNKDSDRVLISNSDASKVEGEGVQNKMHQEGTKTNQTLGKNKEEKECGEEEEGENVMYKPFLNYKLQNRFMSIRYREEAYDKLDYLSYFGRIDLVKKILSCTFMWKPCESEISLFETIVKQLELHPNMVIKVWGVTFINNLNMEQYRVLIVTTEGYYRVNVNDRDGTGRFSYTMFPIQSLSEISFGKFYNTNKKWTMRHFLENSRNRRNYTGVMIKTIHGEVNKFCLWNEERLVQLFEDSPYVIGEYLVKEIVCAFRCIVAYKSRESPGQFVVPIYESVIPRYSKYIFVTMKSMGQDKKTE